MAIIQRSKLVAPKTKKKPYDVDEDVSSIVGQMVEEDEPVNQGTFDKSAAPTGTVTAQNKQSADELKAKKLAASGSFLGNAARVPNAGLINAARSPAAEAYRNSPMGQENAARADAQKKEQEAQFAREAQEQAAKDKAIRDNWNRERDENRDIDGDGKIGTTTMTREDYVQAAIDSILRPVDTAQSRSALETEMEKNNAVNRANARAATGRAGLGASGATAATEGEISSQGARDKELALAEFDRQARNEAAQRAQAGVQMSYEDQVFQEAIQAIIDANNAASGEDAFPDIAAENDGTQAGEGELGTVGSGITANNPKMITASQLPKGAEELSDLPGVYFYQNQYYKVVK